MKVIAILVGASAVIGACYAAGAVFLNRLKLSFGRAEHWYVAFHIGAVLFSNSVFLLTAVHLAHVLSFAALCLFSFLLFYRERLPKLVREARLPLRWRLLTWLLVLPYFALYFVNAMAPEHSPDGSGYHLGYVARYLREHSFAHVTTSMYANLPQGLEMLYLAAFSIGEHSTAPLIHLAFLVLLAGGLIMFAKRNRNAPAGVCAAMLVFVSPVFGLDATSAYNDVALSSCVFCLFYLLEKWRDDQTPSLLIVCGLLAGFCFAVKYTGGLAIPYAIAYVALTLLRRRQSIWKPVLAIGLFAILPTLPWLVKNALTVANPVSPFFNSIFPNPYIHQSLEMEYRRNMQHYGLKTYSAIPFEVCVLGANLEGLLGPVFMLSPLALLAARSALGRRVLVAGAVFAVPYYANIGTRFLLPAAPFAALGLGLVLSPAPTLILLVLLFHATFSIPSLITLYSDRYASRISSEVPYRAALRLESPGDFLHRALGDGYDATQLVNRLVPKDAAIFTFEGLPEAYTRNPVIVGYESAFGNVLGDVVNTGFSPGFIPTRLASFHFSAQRLRGLRVRQLNRAKSSGDDGEWSVSEFRIYNQSSEVPRQPAWRLQAYPCPWEVEDAFDNSLITRWRSWRALGGDMYVQVLFPALLSADAVALQSSRDQGDIRLVLDGLWADGIWHELDANPETSDLPEPPWLRRSAMDELKARGIRYLTLSDGSHEGRDFQKNAARWGVTMIGTAGQIRLYRIE